MNRRVQPHSRARFDILFTPSHLPDANAGASTKVRFLFGAASPSGSAVRRRLHADDACTFFHRNYRLGARWSITLFFISCRSARAPCTAGRAFRSEPMLLVGPSEIIIFSASPRRRGSISDVKSIDLAVPERMTKGRSHAWPRPLPTFMPFIPRFRSRSMPRPWPASCGGPGPATSRLPGSARSFR